MKGANKGKSGNTKTTGNHTTITTGSNKGITNSQSAINNLKQNLANRK